LQAAQQAYDFRDRHLLSCDHNDGFLVIITTLSSGMSDKSSAIPVIRVSSLGRQV